MLISCHIYTHHILYVKHLQSNYISKLLEYAFVPPSLRERHRLTHYLSTPQAKRLSTGQTVTTCSRLAARLQALGRERRNGESLEEMEIEMKWRKRWEMETGRDFLPLHFLFFYPVLAVLLPVCCRL